MMKRLIAILCLCICCGCEVIMGSVVQPLTPENIEFARQLLRDYAEIDSHIMKREYVEFVTSDSTFMQWSLTNCGFIGLKWYDDHKSVSIRYNAVNPERTICWGIKLIVDDLERGQHHEIDLDPYLKNKPYHSRNKCPENET